MGFNSTIWAYGVRDRTASERAVLVAHQIKIVAEVRAVIVCDLFVNLFDDLAGLFDLAVLAAHHCDKHSRNASSNGSQKRHDAAKHDF